MNDETHPQLDRITELLADRALFGLDEAEQRELDALLTAVDAGEFEALSESFEGIAASAQLATLEQIEPMPAELAKNLVEQGQQTFEAQAEPIDKAQPAPSVVAFPRRELLAWFAAAAAVAFALFSVTGNSESPAELRSELLALAKNSSGELTQVTWNATDDPAGKSASGDVVWHNGRQQGVMKISGLRANDRTKSQYQLWIFDSAQQDAYPIDGGVFDIPLIKRRAGSKAEVFIKINAKLPVVNPTMFAITIEKPGGVVVSSRERLPLLAKVISN